MSISGYECEIITQIHHFGCRRLSVATIYGQGKIAESQGISFSRSCGNPVKVEFCLCSVYTCNII